MKISFCTTCMGRLHHLEQTLPLSLIATSSYPNREFVLLNYNSSDNLHNWVKKELKFWISKGILKYYRTLLPKHFVATHAKNIVYKQATGDILCNLDSDNFIIDGFCEKVNEVFLRNSNSIIASNNYDAFMNVGSCGKIICKKEHFYNVNGYDEKQYLGWGWEDTSFQFRTRMFNNLIYHEFDKKWNRVIGHDNQERTKNFQEKDINKSKNFSIDLLNNLTKNKKYIVNQNENWGYIEDLKQYSF